MDDNDVARFLAAWFAVRQFIQSANFNHFHQAGLSATQFMVLNLLPASDGKLSIGELARRMNLKPATVAKTVDTLEERGMLKRTPGKDDRRVVFVQITKPGRQLQNAAVGQFREQIGGAFRSMKMNDRAALIDGLESFVAALHSTAIRESGAPPEKRSSPRSRQP